MKLVPYSEYKDSGVSWLGRIPVHWEMRRLKHLFSERLQKGYPNETLLAATQTRGIISKSMYETRTVTAQKDLHLLKLVEIGDFVISLRSFQGGIEQAYFRGIISPAYTVMIPCSSIERNYFKHLAKSKTFLNLLKTCVTGIRQGQNIDYERLRRYFLPLPSIVEQTQIARFLDSKTAQIDKFTRNKKRLIELLKEQKQNIINQAVTQGLDPNVKLKPSGVEWLGDIPEHWGLRKLKHIVTMKSGENLVSEKISEIGEYPVYGGNGLRGYFNDYNKDGSYLLVGRQGALCGNIHQVDGRFWATEHAIVTKVNQGISTDWCYYMFIAMDLNQYSDAAAQPGISVEKIMNLRTVLPSLGEQEAIVARIKEETVTINYTITRAQREIDLMHEYRARLISDVVTGQVDVRDIEVSRITGKGIPAQEKDALEFDSMIGAELKAEIQQ